MNHNELSEVQKRSNTTTTNEVVHAGTASNSHMRAANTKTAIIRCSTTVKTRYIEKRCRHDPAEKCSGNRYSQLEYFNLKRVVVLPMFLFPLMILIYQLKAMKILKPCFP